jgi:nucleoside-diphosphate-sugar epimerase
MKFNALHHRHPAANGDKLQLPLRQTLPKVQNNGRESGGKSHHRSPFLPTKRNFMRTNCCPPICNGNGWIRHTFLIGIATYFLIMVIQSQLLYQQLQDSSDLYPSPAMFIPGDVNESRNYKSRRELSAHERAQIIREMNARTDLRKRRTTPPLSSHSIARYDVHSLEAEEEPVDRSVRSEAQRPANLGELCGLHAQKSALANPYSYLSRDSLNANARVVITGILNPIGFHLALVLKERCGVESIVGIDSMLPNTVQNRLDLLEQIRILTTNIPQLVQPITLPLMGLDPRLKKRDSVSSVTLLNSTGELNLLTYQPTHIVHLASFAPHIYAINAMNKEWQNSYSPYVRASRSPPMYQLQSSTTSMEQILASMATADVSERPHFTYNSVTKLEQDPTDHFQACSQQLDDVLVDTYHSLCGAFAVGLRLPNAVYGPWTRAGNVVHDLAESFIANWNATLKDSELFTVDGKQPNQQLDLLFVDDVVDAFIAAMQFRSETSSPVLLEVTSGSTVSFASVEKLVGSLGKQNNESTYPPLSSPALSIQQYIQWTPQTSLRDGLFRTIAWHLDRHQPFGKSSTDHSLATTGDEFLSAHGVATCAANDILCHAGRIYLPCISECASKVKCTSSIFEDVVEIVRDVSAGCDIVMYTQSLGRDVDDLKLHVKYIDDSSPQICNLAFVPRNSKVVDTIVRKVPNDQLVKFGVTQKPGETGREGVTQEQKLDGLNGNLLYRGWILIWVRNALSTLSPSDEAMLKVAPGRLFSTDVKSAVFVDQNFSVSPTVEDISFLADELYRPRWKQRSAFRTVVSGKVKKKVKYRLDAEPARRAAMLVSKLKVPQDPNDSIHRERKMSVYEATKFMRAEMGMDPETKESPELQRQREFYERVPMFVNQHDLRSSLEPLYYYEMKHWIRSRWVVHDLRLEESRQVRCEWYQEHVLWGADLDQLTFAHIMAKIELKRRMTHHEPDEHTKPAFMEHPELFELSDAHEWHALNSERNKVPSLAVKKIPDHLVDKDSKDDNSEIGVVSELSGEASPDNETPVLSVRIMSEKVMAMSRAAWIQMKGQRAPPQR